MQRAGGERSDSVCGIKIGRVDIGGLREILARDQAAGRTVGGGGEGVALAACVTSGRWPTGPRVSAGIVGRELLPLSSCSNLYNFEESRVTGYQTYGVTRVSRGGLPRPAQPESEPMQSSDLSTKSLLNRRHLYRRNRSAPPPTPADRGLPTPVPGPGTAAGSAQRSPPRPIPGHAHDPTGAGTRRSG